MTWHDGKDRLLSRLEKPKLGLGAGLGFTNGSQSVPALDLNFLTGQWDNRISFIRGSLATIVDSTGRITYAPNNLVARSDDVSHGSWVKDGITTPDSLAVLETAATGGHDLYQAVGSLKPGRYVVSAEIAPMGRQWMSIDFGSGNQVWFDIVNGVVGTQSGGVIGAITAAGGGYYRVSAAYTLANTFLNVTFCIRTADNGVAAYAGDTAKGLLIRKVQLEAVTYQLGPGVYNATAAAAYHGPGFDHDPVNIGVPRGLSMWEQRTNLNSYSQDWDNAAYTKAACSITANTTVSPDGTANADSWTATGGIGNHRLDSPAFAVTNATVYCASVFLKAGTERYCALTFGGGNFSGLGYINVDLQTGTISASGGTLVGSGVENYGGGWYRAWIAATCTGTANENVLMYIISTGLEARNAGTSGASGTLRGFGLQVEAGSFPSPYIPTAGSSATRGGDLAVMTGSNFSNWYNQKEGTFVVEGDSRGIGTTGSADLFYLDDSVSSQIIAWYLAGSVLEARVINTSATQAALNPTGAHPPDGSVNKLAFAYRVADLAASINHSVVATATSGTIPSGMNRIALGSSTSVSQSLNGHIFSIKYYKHRLSDSELSRLSG